MKMENDRAKEQELEKAKAVQNQPEDEDSMQTGNSQDWLAQSIRQSVTDWK